MSSAADGYRRRRRAEAPAETSFADLMNGFSLDSARRKPSRRGDTPEAPVETRETPARQDEWPAPVAEAAPVGPVESTASIVRAYAWTGGRTRSSVRLEIETLVSANDQGHRSPGMLQAEHQHVIELCRSPRSVAEVAALMRLPLGVAKVLLGDLAERGLVDVHQTASAGGDMPDLGLMERVLSGLRRL